MLHSPGYNVENHKFINQPVSECTLSKFKLKDTPILTRASKHHRKTTCPNGLVSRVLNRRLVVKGQ